MRILIDGSALLLPSSGIRNYLYNWLLHLFRIAAESEHIGIFPLLGSDVSRFGPSQSNVSEFSAGMRLALTRASNKCGARMTDILCGRIDLFHEPNTHVMCPPSNCKLTATVHDMTCWLMPELHAQDNVAETKEFGARVLTRADRIIAVSENTKSDVAAILHIPEERIEVIHHGVSDEFFQVSPLEIRRIRSKYRLSRPYILFVGTLEPRKNLGNLIDAYLRLPGSVRNEFELILAGGAGWHWEQLSERLRAGLAGVRWLGYVPETDLAGLTAGATAGAYPSLYEGFGLPVAQAMAAGVPVLTSNVSSLPEIAGDAAILVNPNSIDEISAGLEQLLLNDSLQRRLGANGRQKASSYRWETCAAKSMDFFHAVCEDRQTASVANSAR